MSDTPPPPPPPGGQQPGYGAPQQPAWQGPPLASWGKRVGSGVIDLFLPWIAWYIVLFIFSAISDVLGAIIGFVGWVAVLAFVLWNMAEQGRTGYSIGKRQMNIKLVRAQDGQVVGAGMSIGRYFLHILDSLPCYIGFLWPLWDPMRQTFADKILQTVVIEG